jgi:enoyl-CoA hydratase/carnithine racemase
VTLTRTDDGPLAILTLDHGELNLFDRAVFDAFEHEIVRLGNEPPRGLLIRAQGRVVSAGVDVHEFQALTPQTAGTLWRELLDTIAVLEDLPCPTVFAAHGLTLTAAFEIALACDLILATESAQFGLVERVVGLTPSMGGPQRLAERAGRARARELVYTGDVYSAEAMREWGVVNRVLPDGGFDDAARAFARSLADGPTRAHAATKRLTGQASVAEADELVPGVSGALFATEDLQNAVASFLRDGPGNATYEGR